MYVLCVDMFGLVAKTTVFSTAIVHTTQLISKEAGFILKLPLSLYPLILDYLLT